LLQLIVEWESSREEASLKELQSLAGLLNFACCVIRPGRFFLRRIIDHTRHVQSLVDGSGGERRGPHAPYSLTHAVRADLAWWREFLPSWPGSSLLYEQEWRDAPSIELF